MTTAATQRRTVLLGTATFGVGLGALLDVLLFHLVLQWHHLLSSLVAPDTLDGLRTNLRYDGLFSLAMVGVMTIGGVLVWRGLNRAAEPASPTDAFAGLLVGIGAFNVVDGVVDHYVLGLHDVVHGTPAFNPHWVGASLLVLGIGVLMLSKE